MLKLLLICIATAINCSGCKTAGMLFEDCLLLDNDQNHCIDGRKKKKEREFKRNNAELYGYSCTNSTDRMTLENRIDLQYKELVQCKRQLKLKCK